jgi:2,3-bisphosphoglycerate-dependent phosphoglycerate mutase
MKLILLRHGQSEWNLENRFTGWKDVSLTKLGIEEAQFSAKAIIENKYNIKSINTSLLNRALETADIVANAINFPRNKIQKNWRLNERHYGALEGLNKSETAKKYGEKQVKIWRRSFDVPPPQIDIKDNRHPSNNIKFNKLNCKLPLGESLNDVILRLKPFLKKYFDYLIKNPGDHLIVAHSNSLRAIVKILENLSNEDIIKVNIPTGVPLIYNLNNRLQIIDKEYLIDDKALKKKEAIIVNQGKIL